MKAISGSTGPGAAGKFVVAKTLGSRLLQPVEPELDGCLIGATELEALTNKLIRHRFARHVVGGARKLAEDGEKPLEAVSGLRRRVRRVAGQHFPAETMRHNERMQSSRDVCRSSILRRKAPVPPGASEHDSIWLTADAQCREVPAAGNPRYEKAMQILGRCLANQTFQKLPDEVVDRAGHECPVHCQCFGDVCRCGVGEAAHKLGREREEIAYPPAVTYAEKTVARRDVGRGILNLEQLVCAVGTPSTHVSVGVVGRRSRVHKPHAA